MRGVNHSSHLLPSSALGANGCPFWFLALNLNYIQNEHLRARDWGWAICKPTVALVDGTLGCMTVGGFGEDVTVSKAVMLEPRGAENRVGLHTGTPKGMHRIVHPYISHTVFAQYYIFTLHVKSCTAEYYNIQWRLINENIRIILFKIFFSQGI